MKIIKKERGNGKYDKQVQKKKKTIVQIGEFKHFYVIFSAISW